MRISINTKDIELTPELEAFIEEKFTSHIRKFVEGKNDPDLPTLHLEVGRSTKHHKKGMVYYAEASLAMGKNVLTAKAESEDVYAACDILRDEMEREVKKFSEKRQTLQKRGAREAKEEMRNQ